MSDDLKALAHEIAHAGDVGGCGRHGYGDTHVNQVSVERRALKALCDTVRVCLRVTREPCTCGGSGPNEGCPACAVYHALSARFRVSL